MQFINYKPLQRSIGNASELIVPAVLGPSQVAALTAWAAGATYAVGDKVYVEDANGTKRGYWCISAGVATAAKQPTAEDGDDTTDSAVTWRRIRGRRNQLIITNDSDTTIYLSFGYAAEGNKGIRLTARGGTFNATQAMGYCPQGDVYGITNTGSSKVLCIQEA